jgi:hypothetical protein
MYIMGSAIKRYSNGKNELFTFLGTCAKGAVIGQGEIISGSVTIRAIKTQEYAIEKNVEKVNIRSLARWVMLGTHSWLNMRGSQACMILVVISCINVLICKLNRVSDIVMTTLLLQ